MHPQIHELRPILNVVENSQSEYARVPSMSLDETAV